MSALITKNRSTKLLCFIAASGVKDLLQPHHLVYNDHIIRPVTTHDVGASCS